MTLPALSIDKFGFEISFLSKPFTTKENHEYRVFFLCEAHHNLIDQERNVQFIRANYHPEDLVLVEDDQSKPKEELNLTQIKGETSWRIEGWDNPESCVKRKKLREIIERINKAIENVRGLKEDEKTSDRILLESLAAKKGFSGDGTLQNLLINSQKYVKDLKNYGALHYFPQRQQALEYKIINFIKNNEKGRLFVLLGSKHVDLHDKNTMSSVSSFFRELKGIKFQILSAPSKGRDRASG